MDPQWNLIRLAACFFIAWTILTAYFMGKVLACLESIAKSLRAVPHEAPRGGGE